MNYVLRKVKAYLFNVDIDINERLGIFFINIGIVAAYLGVLICILSNIPVSGTIATALIATGAPLISSLTRRSNHLKHYGILIAFMIIFMIPIVWLTTGAWSGGSCFWFLYELFYITLFAKKKQLFPYLTMAFIVQIAAVLLDLHHSEWFFHFTDKYQALVSQVGSGIVVTVEILLTVTVQKTLYIHEREINTQTEDITRNFITSIANTIDTKDPYTGGHSRRVAECASAIALRLGMTQDEADNMYFVGLLHDIGKIGVPDSVLNKPGRLTEEEFALIRKHPIYGSEILKNVSMIPHVRDGVLYHHEHYDGSGYPEGLKGEAIPYVARVISVADSYDAMSTTRVYRRYVKREDIIKDMIRCRGTQFDPHIIDVFVQMLREGFDIQKSPRVELDSMEYSFARTSREMMRHINEANPAANRRGAVNVDNINFSNMYDYLCSVGNRCGNTMVLTNISLQTADDGDSREILFDSMTDLNKAIMQNTRAVDIYTRNSSTSFLVLLLDAQVEKVDLIIQRIKDDFYSIHEDKRVVLNYNTIKIVAEVHDKT